MQTVTPQKKTEFIFFGNSVSFPPKDSALKPAKSLEWQLIRAAIRGEPLHFLDGFLIFKTWREDCQKGNYLDLFRKIASNASSTLKKCGVDNAKMIHPNSKPDFWVLKDTGNIIEFNNISDSVSISHQSYMAFCNPDLQIPDLGWILAQQSYDKWPDPKSLAKAICFADSLPNDTEIHQTYLSKFKTMLEEYQNTLLLAMTKVISLAAEKKQGINNDIILPIIPDWIEQHLFASKALDILSKYNIIPPTIDDQEITEFINLAKNCVEYMPYIEGLLEKQSRVSSRKVFSENSEIENIELKEILTKLINCKAVSRVAEKAIVYFEEIKHLRFNKNAVNENLELAVINFLEMNADNLKENAHIYYRFDNHVLHFFKKLYKSESILNVLSSEMDLKTKKERINLWISELSPTENNRHITTMLMNKYNQEYSKQGSLPGYSCNTLSADMLIGLQPMDEVLMINKNVDPEWFRRTGPIASDFKNNTICRQNKKRSLLNDMVFQNLVSILTGDADTGKTVLMREFAYELYDKQEVAIYHFDCNTYRNFDPIALAAKISSISGVFIFEDIHLCTRNIQKLYGAIVQKCSQGTDRHVLFVGRNSVFGNQDPQLETINGLPLLICQPSHKYNIIKSYFEYTKKQIPDFHITPKVIEQIKNETPDSLWLLALTLTGYVKNKGEGNVIAWQQKGINEIFQHLERCGSPEAVHYPEIVVSLSPLKMSELMTSKDYLVNDFKISYSAIEELVVMGEVKKYIDSDEGIFYGLTHSALAMAYWHHGRRYITDKKLRDYFEFICNYVACKLPNSFEVIITLSHETQQHLLDRFQGKNILEELLMKPTTFRNISDWIYCYDAADFFLSNFMDVLANTVLKTNTISDITPLFYVLSRHPEQLERLWPHIDKQELKNKLNKEQDAISVIDFLKEILNFSEKDALELSNSIQFNTIGLSINNIPRINMKCECILWSCYLNIFEKLKQYLDNDKLVNEIIHFPDPFDSCHGIIWICLTDKTWANQILSLIPISILGDILLKVQKGMPLVQSVVEQTKRELEGMELVDLCLKRVSEINEKYSSELRLLLHSNSQ